MNGKTVNEVYYVDNMEYMATVPDKFFDLCFPDPPYGINAGKQSATMYNKNFGKKKILNIKLFTKDWDSKPPSPEYFKAIKKISNHQFIWGANYFKEIVGKVFKPIRRKYYDQFIKDNPTNWFIWDKKNGNCDQSDCEMMWSSIPIKTEIFRYLWHGAIKQKPIKCIHPTQKPVDVYDYIFRKFCKPEWKVLDTHVGSGSSRISADKLGLYFIGCENNEEHFNDQEKRFSEYLNKKLSQTNLFSQDEMQDLIFQGSL